MKTSCYRKQLALHKLPLPVEVLHIVYDYCFKTVMGVQRQKKAAVLDVLKNDTCIVMKEMYLGIRCRPSDKDRVKYFMVFLKDFPKEKRGYYASDYAENYLSFAICSTCGLFVNPKTKARNDDLVMRYPGKQQYHDRECSPFRKVTCFCMY